VDEAGSTLGCVTALGRLATMGYVDAWRRGHAESRERTWSHPWVGGTRIDGVYVSAAMAGGVAWAELVHGPREAGHSDHSMVVVEVA
jgi:exodeoxyribonuclease-3